MGLWAFIKSALRDDRKRKKAKAAKAMKNVPRARRAVGPKNTSNPALFDQGEHDGLKGRANRYASRDVLEQSAWKAASSATRARQIRGGYTEGDHGLSVDPYGNQTMIRIQLAAPGTPDAYRRGYLAGTRARKKA